MNLETSIQNSIRLAAAPAILFRNNLGAYSDRNGVFVRYGVASPGGSDLIGWNSVRVTQNMVGGLLAIFTAIEVKTAKGMATPAQLNFLRQVSMAGGLAGIARSPEDAKRIIRGH